MAPFLPNGRAKTCAQPWRAAAIARCRRNDAGERPNSHGGRRAEAMDGLYGSQRVNGGDDGDGDGVKGVEWCQGRTRGDET